MPNRSSGRAPGSLRATPLVLHILLSLADGPAHAYGIMKEIEGRTGGRLNPGPGSIHFTLSKLLDGEMIKEWKRAKGADDDSRRRYYALSARGRALLADEIDALEEIVAVARSKNLAVRRRG